MRAAYVGIDAAFAKHKRLPIVVAVREGDRLAPLPLRASKSVPPVGSGNANILHRETVVKFAEDAGVYLANIEREFCIRIQRIAIDAPSNPKAEGTPRRNCELALDKN